MKKVMIFGLLIAGVYLASCNTNGVTPTDTTAAITASSARIAHDSTGAGRSKDTIAVSALPAAITAYIKTTYPTSTIHRAAKHTDGTYSVVIIDALGVRTGLRFDAAGVFVSAFVKGNKSGKDSTHVKGGTEAPKDTTKKDSPKQGGKKGKKG